MTLVLIKSCGVQTTESIHVTLSIILQCRPTTCQIKWYMMMTVNNFLNMYTYIM